MRLSWLAPVSWAFGIELPEGGLRPGLFADAARPHRAGKGVGEGAQPQARRWARPFVRQLVGYKFLSRTRRREAGAGARARRNHCSRSSGGVEGTDKHHGPNASADPHPVGSFFLSEGSLVLPCHRKARLSPSAARLSPPASRGAVQPAGHAAAGAWSALSSGGTLCGLFWRHL